MTHTRRLFFTVLLGCLFVPAASVVVRAGEATPELPDTTDLVADAGPAHPSRVYITRGNETAGGPETAASVAGTGVRRTPAEGEGDDLTALESWSRACAASLREEATPPPAPGSMPAVRVPPLSSRDIGEGASTSAPDGRDAPYAVPVLEAHNDDPVDPEAARRVEVRPFSQSFAQTFARETYPGAETAPADPAAETASSGPEPSVDVRTSPESATAAFVRHESPVVARTPEPGPTDHALPREALRLPDVPAPSRTPAPAAPTHAYRRSDTLPPPPPSAWRPGGEGETVPEPLRSAPAESAAPGPLARLAETDVTGSGTVDTAHEADAAVSGPLGPDPDTPAPAVTVSALETADVAEAEAGDDLAPAVTASSSVPGLPALATIAAEERREAPVAAVTAVSAEADFEAVGVSTNVGLDDAEAAPSGWHREAEAPQPIAETLEVTVAGEEVAAEAASLREDLLAAARTTGGESAANLLRGRTLYVLSLDKASEYALRQGLAVQVAQKDVALADAEVLSASSTFLPTFGASISYADIRTDQRSEWIYRPRFDTEQFQDDFDRFESEFNETGIGQIVVDGDVVWTAWGYGDLNGVVRNPINMLWGVDYASMDAEYRSGALTLMAALNLPWGAAISGSANTNYFYRDYPEVDENSMYEWATSWQLDATIPLPCMKDFGPYGSTEIVPKLAKASRTVAIRRLERTINESLLQTVLAYWDLTRATRRLEATRASRSSVESIASRTSELLEAERVTAYADVQTRGELARVRTLEEQAWADYLQASNALVALLDAETDFVYFPRGGTGSPDGTLQVDPEAVLASAVERNPDLELARAELAWQELTWKHMRNQQRPDLKLVGTISQQQLNSTIGYNTFEESLEHLDDPDIRDRYIGLRFSMPWGNNPAEARTRQAELRLEQSRDRLKAARNALERSVRTALADLRSAEGRVAAAETNYEASLQTWTDAQDLFDARRITQFELIGRNSEALSAHYELIDARIEEQKAAARLLAAEGRLSEVYAPNVTVRYADADAMEASE